MHVYEPSPGSYGRIVAHARLNRAPNVYVTNRAVGGEAGTVPLYINNKSALTTMFDNVRGQSIDGSERVDVDVDSINDVLQRIDGEIPLAKIDCEGAEFEIMENISAWN